MKERLERWLGKIGVMEFPVLQHTKERLSDPETLNNAQVTDALETDVGLAINVIHHVNTHARGHLNHRLTTLEYASTMLGISRIQELALSSPTVEDLPEKQSRHLLHAYGRALHCAMISREISVMRNDLVPDELYLAGLLHGVGGLAMWLLAANGMRTVRALLKHHCHSADEIEYLVFGFTQSNLSLSLAKKWNMPEVVAESMQAGAASQPRLRGVMLAERLSYVSSHGCKNNLVENCLEEIAKFLKRTPESVMERLLTIHNSCLKMARQYGELFDVGDDVWQQVYDEKASLIKENENGEQEEEQVEKVDSTTMAQEEEAVICIAPRLDLMNFFDGYIRDLAASTASLEERLTLSELLLQTAHLLHDAVGLNRVMYASVVSDVGSLQTKFTAGSDRDINFNLFSIDLSQDSIFKRQLDDNSSIWMTRAKWERLSELIPRALGKMNPTHSFFSQALYVRGKPHGIFYADRRIAQCELDHLAYQRFQEMVGKCQFLVNQLLVKS